MDLSLLMPYIARMRYISRWGLMRNTEPENIQEHSHMVAVLAHALAVIRRDRLRRHTSTRARRALAALYHDAPEILTGDLPTPVKYDNPGDPGGLQGRWRTTRPSGCWSMLPQELRAAYAAAACTSAGPGGPRPW